MMETMEKYMSKTYGNYWSGVVRLKINDKTHFELKGQYLKELRENISSGSEHEDANEHTKKFLEIIDLFHIIEVTQDQVMLRVFLMSLTGATSGWLKNEPSGSITNWETLKTLKIKLAVIQAQLNNLRREIKKVNEKVYAAQTLQESLTKFMAESTKRYEENSNIIKEIRASTDADEDDHEEKSLDGTLIDIPVFVGKFSILAGFIIIYDEDVTIDVVLDMPFFMKYVSCQMVMKKFALRDKCERMMENESWKGKSQT
nr:hypothetical protein [Tanacetum cinerariifolium]